MANENEPAKLLLPYLQRADELQKHDPLVSYYCRLYAMERGLKFPQSERTKTTNNLLVSLMKQLEKDKKSLKLGPDDQLHLEGFALNVFEKADKQDRAGRANLNTAKTFYAASIFFEILNQFGELQPDLEQKQKYAAWKASDIRKAIKEGRTPIPGPPGGEDNFSIPTSTSSVENDWEPSQPDAAVKSAPVHPPPQFYDKVQPQHTADISPPPSNPLHTADISPPPSNPLHTADISPPPSNNSPAPAPYSNSNYALHDIHPSQNNRSEDMSYTQTYHHQPYPQEPHQPFPQNYPSHEAPSYSYPNFQSYPSFTESSLPTAPSHYPSYYQGSEASYHPNSDSAQYISNSSFGTPHNESPPAPSKLNQHVSAPAPTISNQNMYAQFNASGRNGNALNDVPAPVQSYQYDSNYQPAPEKIAEAHKTARFAVGALAFDDVSTAVDFLKKSLELLTNPAAGNLYGSARSLNALTNQGLFWLLYKINSVSQILNKSSPSLAHLQAGLLVITPSCKAEATELVKKAQMGAAMCGLMEIRQEGQQREETEVSPEEHMRPKFFEKLKKKKRKALQIHRVHENQQALTLEDFLVVSPHLNNRKANTNGGDISKRVFPSPAEDLGRTISPNSRESLHVEKESDPACELNTHDVQEVDKTITRKSENRESISRRVRFTLPSLGEIVTVSTS